MCAKVTGLGHLAINVRDIDKSLAFYCGALGLEQVFEINMPEDIETLYPGHTATIYAGKPWITYLRVAKGEYIELFRPYPNADPDSAGPVFDNFGFVHFCLVVDDIYAMVAALKEKGVHIDSEATLGPDQTYQAWIRDPDGNRIELFQYTEESMQVVIDSHRQ